MNKYQEAIEFLKKYNDNDIERAKRNRDFYGSADNSLYESDDCFALPLNKLQELVDKATPKKPLNIYYGLTEQVCNCPNCNKKIYESLMELAYSKDDDLEYFKEVNFSNCNRCGQAIDWSIE